MNAILPDGLLAGAIVVGVDGTPHSQQSVEWAVELGRVTDRPVAVVHVWEYVMPSAAYGYVVAYTPTEAEQNGQTIVDDAIAPYVDGDVPVTGHLINGGGWGSLVDVSAKAWLLVVGVHHHSLAHGLLGSFAHRVVSHARCATVVVPTTTVVDVTPAVITTADEALLAAPVA